MNFPSVQGSTNWIRWVMQVLWTLKDIIQQPVLRGAVWAMTGLGWPAWQPEYNNTTCYSCTGQPRQLNPATPPQQTQEPVLWAGLEHSTQSAPNLAAVHTMVRWCYKPHTESIVKVWSDGIIPPEPPTIQQNFAQKCVATQNPVPEVSWL